MVSKNSAFAGLHLDCRFTRELPADPELSNQPRQVHGSAYSWVAPTKVSEPKLLACNLELAQTLGFSATEVESPLFSAVFSGNRALLEPDGERSAYAVCYGGHQFGHWAGQLGDGRALGLAEVIGLDGARYELQLKGAGPTPYSRHADGRAVLRSSLREYLCSEAMHGLGVPTTRALSLISSGDAVVRDMFYSGDPRAEPGAIVCRVAPSFIRFGNFELAAARGDLVLLDQWVAFTISRDFPHLTGAGDELRVSWLVEVAERTADLMVHWLRVGFVHGVMNTDNLSILGLTIDYGPYGWLDSFDPNWTPNTTDAEGRRYAYAKQPQVAYWNLNRLVAAIAPLMADKAALEVPLKAYVARFNHGYVQMLGAKLGILEPQPDDLTLSSELHELLHSAEVDMTIFYRQLAMINCDAPLPEPLFDAFYSPDLLAKHAVTLNAWLEKYALRLRGQAEVSDTRVQRMQAINPRYVPRNYLAQQAIDAAERGDLRELHTLLTLFKRPYDEQPEFVRYALRRPDWARERAGCSSLSCSS